MDSALVLAVVLMLGLVATGIVLALSAPAPRRRGLALAAVVLVVVEAYLELSGVKVWGSFSVKLLYLIAVGYGLIGIPRSVLHFAIVHPQFRAAVVAGIGILLSAVVWCAGFLWFYRSGNVEITVTNVSLKPITRVAIPAATGHGAVDFGCLLPSQSRTVWLEVGHGRPEFHLEVDFGDGMHLSGGGGRLAAGEAWHERIADHAVADYPSYLGIPREIRWSIWGLLGITVLLGVLVDRRRAPPIPMTL